jgi:pimeloyl-ACP methyl ester carboxylesterase
MRWLALLLTTVLLPVPALASGEVVQGVRELPAGKHQLSTIRIAKNATLRLLAGAVVSFREGTALTGEGRLEVVGTPGSSVVVVGLQTLQVSGGARLQHLRIASSGSTIVLGGDELSLNHVRLAGVSLELRPANGSVDVSVRNVQLDSLLSEVPPRVTVLGAGRELFFEKVTFPAKRLVANHPVLEVAAEWRGLQLIGLKSSDGCFLVGTMKKGEPYRGVIDPACQPPTPPVLFIPGYGTSLNLRHLQEPIPASPTTEGWSFLPVGTAQYRELLHELRERSVPVRTAYYDWRLPPTKIVEQYIIPALRELQRAHGVTQVGIVAHSFGGLLARSYIQSEVYRNDVAYLVMAGTPNAGAVKAYGPWQAASFPPDWRPVSNLIRYYRYKFPEAATDDTTALRQFFPSAQSLLPTFPFLGEGGKHRSLIVHQNRFLHHLQSTEHLLLERVHSVAVMAGEGHTTDQHIPVGDISFVHHLWADGKPMGPTASTSLGDGTVLRDSALISGALHIKSNYTHAEILNGFTRRLERVYPDTAQASAPARGAARNTSFLWFAFDCPIDVRITTGSGETYLSTSESEQVFHTEEILWMFVPAEMEPYEILIKAHKDTEVRWWVDDSSIESFGMRENEEVIRLLGATNAQEQEEPQYADEPDESIHLSLPPWEPQIPQLMSAFQRAVFFAEEGEQMRKTEHRSAAPRLRVGFLIIFCGLVVGIATLLRRGLRRFPP